MGALISLGEPINESLPYDTGNRVSQLIEKFLNDLISIMKTAADQSLPKKSIAQDVKIFIYRLYARTLFEARRFYKRDV